MKIQVYDYESTTAAWLGRRNLYPAIQTQTSGLRQNDMPHSDLETWIGRVAGVEDVQLGAWQSRNNALAALGLEQGSIKASVAKAIEQHGAIRIGLVMGSSTSSIDRTEEAYRHLDEHGQLTTNFIQPKVHNPHAPSLFVAHYLGIQGPQLTINTACSSSAKVFATAARWLQHNIVDVVLVGGVDTLCLSVLHGFNSLQLVSKNQCRPFDDERDGINLGEGAGYALLARADDSQADAYLNLESKILLTGYGESSDAHHMSHPHPEGLGAELAIQQALQMSGLESKDIDYINLHGTSSRANDLIEGKLVEKLFPRTTIASSSKAWTGHTLGAAGITESLIAVEAALHNLAPGSKNLNVLDKALDFNISAENRAHTIKHVMSNSFGFGGNNCTLVFAKEGL